MFHPEAPRCASYILMTSYRQREMEKVIDCGSSEPRAEYQAQEHSVLDHEKWLKVQTFPELVNRATSLKSECVFFHHHLTPHRGA